MVDVVSSIWWNSIYPGCLLHKTGVYYKMKKNNITASSCSYGGLHVAEDVFVLQASVVNNYWNISSKQGLTGLFLEYRMITFWQILHSGIYTLQHSELYFSVTVLIVKMVKTYWDYGKKFDLIHWSLCQIFCQNLYCCLLVLFYLKI